MLIWSVSFDEKKLENFPQILYKQYEINIVMETKLINQIIKIFYLTNRDKKDDIDKIVQNKTELPYKALHQLVFPATEYEFQAQYLIDLLNMFSLEVDQAELEKL